jgi:hypothetical protein
LAPSATRVDFRPVRFQEPAHQNVPLEPSLPPCFHRISTAAATGDRSRFPLKPHCHLLCASGRYAPEAFGHLDIGRVRHPARSGRARPRRAIPRPFRDTTSLSYTAVRCVAHDCNFSLKFTITDS